MSPSDDASTGRVLLGLALAYLLFAVYGSLVPLEYRQLALEEAWARFHDIPFLDLGVGSRADWVANILLFVPLTFLWVGLLWPRGTGPRVLISVLVWLGAVILSLGIEFTQLYFPQRTVSQNDLLAEAIGAWVGILLWWWRGEQALEWVARWRRVRGPAGVAEYLLWIWLGGLFLYSLLPLDLTISPVEIYHKWSHGAVNLVPFAYPVEDKAQLAYDLLTDVAVWIPVSLLWVLSGRKGALQAWLWTLGAALALEVAQFFVFSRVSDVTDLVTAAAGAGIGVGLAARLSNERLARAPVYRPGRLLWILMGVAVWILGLAALFWYPFDFHLEREFLRERLGLLSRVPFYSYYYGTEFRAVTELLHKVLFFLPMGALLALGHNAVRRGVGRNVFDVVAVALMAGVPFLVELGQVALPGKYPDTTDWLLEMTGCALGFVGTLLVRQRLFLARPLAPVRGRALDAGG